MQATVHSFDPDSRAGTVVTDDGILLPFSGEVFDASPLLLLRQGQRLTIAVAGVGADVHVTALELETVGVVPTRPSRP